MKYILFSPLVTSDLFFHGWKFFWEFFCLYHSFFLFWFQNSFSILDSNSTSFFSLRFQFPMFLFLNFFSSEFFRLLSFSSKANPMRRKSFQVGDLYHGTGRQNQVVLSHRIIHFPMSLGVSERCQRTNERTSKWPSTYVWTPGCSRLQCGPNLETCTMGIEV